MTDQVKKNKDIKEDEERLKEQEKKENRKYLHFTSNLFDYVKGLFKVYINSTCKLTIATGFLYSIGDLNQSMIS